MAEKWRTEKKRPTIKVLPWPAIPVPTVDEVYAGVDEKRKEYSLWVESAVRQQFNADKPESLDGIRVLDMTANMEIGHWCSSHFSELGAEVIMVEPPGGDPIRKLTPFGREEYMFQSKNGEKVGARVPLRGAEQVLRHAQPRDRAGKGAAEEDHPAGRHPDRERASGTLRQAGDRLPAALRDQPAAHLHVGRPARPMGSPEGRRRNLDPTAQCSMGFTHGTGAPVSFGALRRGPAGGCATTSAAPSRRSAPMAALYARERFLGKGQFVECTAAEGVIRIIDYNWAWQGMDGSIRPRYGNWDLAINIYAVNPCATGRSCRRRARPPLVPDLADRREGQARARAAHLRGSEAARRDRPASALHAGRDVHDDVRVDQGQDPERGRDRAAGRGSGVGRRVVPRRGVRVSATTSTAAMSRS